MAREDVEFMSELDAAAELRPSRASSAFLYAIGGFFLWSFLWAAFAHVDERAHGTGQVMPSSDIQVVQSLEGGILSELLVSEGDRVKKDQVLVRIDDVQFASEGRGIEAQMMGLRAKQARLKAEVAASPFIMPADITQKAPDVAANEEKLYKSRAQELETGLSIIADEVREAESNLAEVGASIGKLAKSRDLLQKELTITEKLVEKKAKPELELIQLQREMNETSGNLATASQSREALQSRLSAARKKEDEKRGSFRSQAIGELNEVETKLAAIQESFKSAEDRVRRRELRSPVDGIVQKIRLKTQGGIIEPAMKLVDIVPIEDDLMVRAKISPADVAFLKPGQDVRVSITAYDPQLYGSLHGRLERISADTVKDADGSVYFEIDVRTDKNHLGTDEAPLPIAPGMIAETEVITGKRTILTYLLKPLLRAKNRALSER